MVSRKDWKIEPWMGPSEDLPLPGPVFYSEEMDRIRQGFLPSQMEDKWFLYFEEGALYCYRSWTGIPVFRIFFQPYGDGAILEKILFNASAVGDDPDSKYWTQMANYLVRSLLLGQAVSLPFPKDFPSGDPLKAAMFSHGVAGVGAGSAAPTRLRLTLAAIDRNLVQAWRREFAVYPEVEILEADLFTLSADAVVSPANSFGIMDGGLDGKLRDHFGLALETKVRSRIRTDWAGELPVGAAFVTATGDGSFGHLVTAPTMRVPEDVSGTINAYLAMKALLRASLDHRGIRTLVVPGLATLSGRMPADRAARQMRAAYEKVVLGLYPYSHWREEKQFEAYLKGEQPFPPEDLER